MWPDTAATRSLLCARNGRGGETHAGDSWLAAREERKEQEGFKNKPICSALLKIEKVALKSSPTKGLKVEQAPNRQRLSAK